MLPFLPLVRNPHLLTIAGNYWPRTLDEHRFPVRERCFDIEPGVRVLAKEQRPQRTAAGELVLLHGLEGSANGGYMRSMAQAALEAGYAVWRVNIRGCGGTERHCNTLYHAGLTHDLLHILRELRGERRGPLYAVGFSLGGNVVLKMAGELGQSASELIEAAVAISTPIDLAMSVRALLRRQNIIYQRRFVGRMKARLLERHRHMPDLFPIANLDRIRTVYEFDDRLTAPAFGFGGADRYYRTQSAANFLANIRVETLLVQSKDDPLVPFEMFDNAAIAANPKIELVAADHGGHLGFLSAERPRFWVDRVVMGWLAERNKRTALAVTA